MKKLAAVLLFAFAGLFVWAGNPYRTYLLLSYKPVNRSFENVLSDTSTAINQAHLKALPRYSIPKGAVFCRMEDKVTRTTGLWFKLGVGAK